MCQMQALSGIAIAVVMIQESFKDYEQFKDKIKQYENNKTKNTKRVNV
jgi:hypothetical protein